MILVSWAIFAILGIDIFAKLRLAAAMTTKRNFGRLPIFATYAILGSGLSLYLAYAAVGGRASLVGPIVGAFIVNGAKSWLTVAYPEFWLYFLGLLFIGVTLFLPNGVVGLVKKLSRDNK